MGTLIALIICTVLCLAFKESRGLGIAGVLILILVAPLMSGALLVVAGLAYYFLLRRRRRGIGLLLLASGVAGLLAPGHAPPDEGESRSRPAAWCASRDSWSGWTRAQLTVAGGAGGRESGNLECW